MSIDGLVLSPENQKRLQHALELHGLKDLKDLPGYPNPNLIAFFLESTIGLIGRHGEDYIRENKKRLLLEMEIVAEM